MRARVLDQDDSALDRGMLAEDRHPALSAEVCQQTSSGTLGRGIEADLRPLAG
jgi:hypothetical protein